MRVTSHNMVVKKYLSVDLNEEPGCFLTGWSAWYTGYRRRKGREREDGRERREV
jgi:hypothetical protein